MLAQKCPSVRKPSEPVKIPSNTCYQQGYQQVEVNYFKKQ